MELTIAQKIALGQQPIDPQDCVEVRASWRHYSTSLKTGHETHRMVWRDGEWRYLSKRRLPHLSYRTRNEEITEPVANGELLAQHERGGRIEAVYLVDTSAEKPLRSLDFRRTADGHLLISITTSDTIKLPDPRR
jgi:hypothetical protein